MLNIVYCTVLAGMLYQTYEIIDSNIPNGVSYYVSLYLPFV